MIPTTDHVSSRSEATSRRAGYQGCCSLRSTLPIWKAATCPPWCRVGGASISVTKRIQVSAQAIVAYRHETEVPFKSMTRLMTFAEVTRVNYQTDDYLPHEHCSSSTTNKHKALTWPRGPACALCPPTQYNDICWKGASENFEELGNFFPSAQLELDGNVRLDLSPFRYLFLSRPAEYCLSIFDNGFSGTLIGTGTVQDVLVTVSSSSSGS